MKKIGLQDAEEGSARYGAVLEIDRCYLTVEKRTAEFEYDLT